MVSRQEQQAVKTKVQVSNETAGALATISGDSILQFGEQATAWIETLPKNVGAYYHAYQKPLLYLAYLLTVIVTFKLTSEVLGAVGEIPLLAPLMQLVGIGYTVWFVPRFVVSYEKRKELGAKINGIKSYLLGE